MHLLCIAVTILISCAVTKQEDPDKFNSARVEEVLRNKRLLNAYIKCVLEEGACTAEGKELKCKYNMVDSVVSFMQCKIVRPKTCFDPKLERLLQPPPAQYSDTAHTHFCTSYAAHITTALQTGCIKCTDVHREALQKVIKHLIQHNNKQWMKLVDKYDPERKYTAKYEKEMKNLFKD